MPIAESAPPADVATDEELCAAVDRALGRLGMAWGQLEAQAEAADFESEAARLTWIAIKDLAFLNGKAQTDAPN